jgi:NAD(P)-dependent dehydrogenase (short-subunit alcohol dehydrogenase family)
VHDFLDFTNKVVLVTGGTKGIGRGIAEGFAEAGATVVTCARSAPEKSLAGGITLITADIRDPDQCSRVVGEVASKHGRLDVLVNNAGGSPPAESAGASARFSEAILKLNLLAPLWLSQAANAAMQAQDSGGVIVNIGSVSALRPSPNTVAYGAAKAGLLNIRTEQAPLFYGDEEGIAKVAATVPLGRLGEPSDIAGACLFAASDLCPYMSGANILVHGGGEAPGYLAARG